MAASSRQVVVITGASAGVGRAAARRFARAGTSLALIARDALRLGGARQEAEELDSCVMTIPMDVANAPVMLEAAARIEETLGPIDIWINDAMVTVVSEFKDMEPDEFLERLGLEAKVLDSGCRGMAGSFGFEAKHYDISMQCGRRVLLPAVAKAPADMLVCADGFSCREQILQATGRRPLHMAQLLELALAQRSVAHV